MSQMEGFFQSAPTDPRLLAVAENTAQVNQVGLTQSKTEAPACWPEKKDKKVAWRPISRDPNTHQAFQTEQDKEPSQALDQKIPLLRCQKKKTQTNLPLVFSGLECLWWSQWAVQATKPCPQKTRAFTRTHGFFFFYQHKKETSVDVWM